MEAGKYMKEKVNVTGVPETMVQTLYARAKETKKKNAVIYYYCGTSDSFSGFGNYL